MELRQLKYFMEVARVEHMTQASENLHVAQSAVSRQIIKLEEELGVALFERIGRNMRLTNVGKDFLAQAKRAVNELQKAEAIVTEYTNPKIGTVRVGLPNSLATKVLPAVISEFRKNYPDISYQFMEGSNAELTNMLLSGDLDLTFLSPVPTETEFFYTTRFFDEKLKVIVPKSHPLSNELTLTLHDLKNEKFILYPNDFDLFQIVQTSAEKKGIRLDIAFQSTDFYTIQGLVGAGLGISILPEMILDGAIFKETISIPLRDKDLRRSVGLITAKKRKLSPSEQLFYEFILAFFKSK
ncbi:LysR family transcriptional regulator [Listeria fleischmannii]|uniref:LysR family transcriptional regulator n=1 Tax=Listeria fleischmannii TaxID=1069827 RepID=A0A841YGL1_9LIST|nr:LysR family transcriptional regulator [Listeria fleischmannii]EIA19213.1 transcription activator of glutamate synthase operon GltC [Listeria fleischmannii subsp. coloradonensis]MBC1399451.1 LysR family transcriptional regulator [Listeria fleischmannii]MBC1419275.1 LysR family transcriptional regulator [Listeria fleischmannii]MBC1427821.1 LysR family transcriptional regulator [Listeria fleischmannii]STY46652.1 HTH-type transcriptional regulator gltC [Listeria fleischmannii subsp. coloradonen